MHNRVLRLVQRAAFHVTEVAREPQLQSHCASIGLQGKCMYDSAKKTSCYEKC